VQVPFELHEFLICRGAIGNQSLRIEEGRATQSTASQQADQDEDGRSEEPGLRPAETNTVVPNSDCHHPIVGVG
jgi:hypothetical protein